ncbi:MAG: hypothetical protein KDN22_23050 [Verrucomicrobiae bacterium]|nr:hypothetical protein [Verrucomicrobiae bacterium]
MNTRKMTFGSKEVNASCKIFLYAIAWTLNDGWYFPITKLIHRYREAMAFGS